MSLSAEARLWWDHRPSHAQDWFRSLGPAAAVDAETRRDDYLLNGGSQSIGIKKRGQDGEWEIKVLVADDWLATPFGTPELWVKEGARLPMDAVATHQCALVKRRLRRRYLFRSGAIIEGGLPSKEPASLPADERSCGLELTEVIAGDDHSTWWTLALEVNAGLDSAESTLMAIVQWLCDRSDPPDFKPSLSGGYPAWLSKTGRQTRRPNPE